MARSKSKSKKKYRTVACKHLVQLNEVSNSGYPLCRCEKRNLVISPFNIVCQVCVLYRRNKAGITHSEVYKADEADDFEYDVDDMNLRINVNLNPTEDDDIFGSDEFEEDEEDEEYDFEEEIEGPVIGVEDSIEEDKLEYHDEAEEAFSLEEDEMEESDYDEYEEDIFGEEKEIIGEEEGYGSAGIDFEEEVINKIKDLGDKELCPFCKKAKNSVVRHLYRCKKAPDEVKEALKEWRKEQSEKKSKKKKKKKKAKPTKKKKAKKKQKAPKTKVEWDDSLDYVEDPDDADVGLVYFKGTVDTFKKRLKKKDNQLKRKRSSFKSLVKKMDELKDNEIIEMTADEASEVGILLRNRASGLDDEVEVRYYKK